MPWDRYVEAEIQNTNVYDDVAYEYDYLYGGYCYYYFIVFHAKGPQDIRVYCPEDGAIMWVDDMGVDIVTEDGDRISLATLESVSPALRKGDRISEGTYVGLFGKFTASDSMLQIHYYSQHRIDYWFWISGANLTDGSVLTGEVSGDANSGTNGGYDSDLTQYRTLMTGMSGDDVSRLKIRLSELGYYKTPRSSGSYTAATADVIAVFQERNNLEPTGVATPETQAVLFSDRAVPMD